MGAYHSSGHFFMFIACLQKFEKGCVGLGFSKGSRPKTFNDWAAKASGSQRVFLTHKHMQTKKKCTSVDMHNLEFDM